MCIRLIKSFRNNLFFTKIIITTKYCQSIIAILNITIWRITKTSASSCVCKGLICKLLNLGDF